MDLHFVPLEGFVVKLANIEVITDVERAEEVYPQPFIGEFQSVVWLLSGRAIALEMTRDEALDVVSQACAAIDAQGLRVLRPS
tara:strand:- start:24 stop:272 length:249 start_codon:yes stop_codon:yes gene_type:complete